MKLSFAKMLLRKVLDSQHCESIKLNFIFETEKVQFKNSEGKIIDNSIDSKVAFLFLPKLKKEYPNGKFLSLQIFENKMVGEVLMNDNVKEEINITL